MEAYTILCALILFSAFREALTCQEPRDVGRIAQVLAGVPDWQGLADTLNIRSIDIEANCALQGIAQAQCFRRNLVLSYCNSQPSGDPYKVAEDIAKALEQMDHKLQAEQLRKLEFDVAHSPPPPHAQSADVAQSPPPPHSQSTSEDSRSGRGEFTSDSITDFIQQNWISCLFTVMTLFISTFALVYYCAKGKEIRSVANHGKTTREYKKVRNNLKRITDVLQLNPPTNQRLRQKFIEKGWLGLTANPTEEQLVTLVLGRIEQDASQYGKFIAMLHDMEGMDLIVKTLED